MSIETSKTTLLNYAALSILLSGVLYLGIISSSSPSSSTSNPLLFPTKHLSAAPTSSDANVPKPDELELALSRAAMANKTLIITIVNRAYAEQGIESDRTMLDLFIDSFWLGEGTRSLLDHVLVVTMDRTAHRRCIFRRLNCYRLATEGVDFGSNEKLYMSHDFVAMMWRRTLFLADVLRRGYNFIFTDTDIVWLRNPFDRLSHNQTEDLQISTDWFDGDPWSEKNYINTGFYFVRSNNKTISLFDTWYSQKDNVTGKKEQDVLLELVQGGIFGDLGLRVRFLDTVYFSGFCNDSKDFTAVTTVHANCCRSIKAKVHDLTAVFRDWKRFQWSSQRLSGSGGGGRNQTASYKWSKHLGCLRSWMTYVSPPQS